MDRSARIPVLMYHDLDAGGARAAVGHAPYVIPAAAFEDQLAALPALRLRTCRLTDLLDGAGGDGACVVTFDDGHASNYTCALPLLQKHGGVATFFITTGWVGTAGYMTWAMAKALADAGMEIGSHSVSHRPPVSLTPEELRSEMADSKKRLEDRLGIPVTTASSPTGFYSPAIVPAAREAGYRALCCGRVARWRPARQPFVVPRIAVKPGMTPASFAAVLRGDPRVLGAMRARQMARDTLKRLLGVERYLKVRRAALSTGARD